MTLIVYVPATNGNIVVLALPDVTKPAFVDEAVQLYTFPGTLVTDRLIVVPLHAGLGVAVKLAGALGLLGFVSTTGPAYTPELQPLTFEILKSV